VAIQTVYAVATQTAVATLTKVASAGTATSTQTGTPTPGTGSACGTYLLQWGSFGTGNGQFDSPSFVAVDGVGDVYVTDSNNNRVQKFNSNGTYLLQWGCYGPAGIAADSNGDVYVADSSYSRVEKYSPNGTFLSQWGSPGTGKGQFSYPAGLAIDAGGNVYVADANNGRIQKFNAAGTYLLQWGTSCIPYGMGSDGVNVYVTMPNSAAIQKFSSTGASLGLWGWMVNGPDTPFGIAGDQNGDFFMTDYIHVNKLDSSTGNYLASWGSHGTGPGQFSSPCGIAKDGSGNIYVVDTNNNRIQKFYCP
jgi:streptogramin lyase